MERVLMQQVEKFCAGGKKFVESEDGKRKVREVAFNKRLKTGNASFFNRLGQKKRASLSVGLTLFAGPPNRKSLLAAAMRRFPDKVTVQDGYHRLQNAQVGTGFAIDRETKAGQKAAWEAREGAGFHAKQTSSGWVWRRNTRDN